MARPRIYSDALGEKVCDLIVEGFTLRQIGRMPGMPSKSTILRWAWESSHFRWHYAAARQACTEYQRDEASYVRMSVFPLAKGIGRLTHEQERQAARQAAKKYKAPQGPMPPSLEEVNAELDALHAAEAARLRAKSDARVSG